MVTVGDAQNGKRKVENVDNPKNFPHTKAFGRFYGAKVAAGLLVVVVGIQLINGVLDFFWNEPKKHDRKQRDNRRR